MALLVSGNLGRCTDRYDASARFSTLRADVDNVVGNLDYVGVVLDDYDRVALVHQGVEHAEQLAYVLEMQARCRLIENVQRPLCGGPVAGGILGATIGQHFAEQGAKVVLLDLERTREVAEAGYYAVPLTRYGIVAEMTATKRVGMHRYTFPEGEEAAIVIDLENGGCWDESTETFMHAEGKNRIVGYRYSKGWAKNQRIYFAAEFAKPFDSFELKGYKDMYGRASVSYTHLTLPTILLV